jgi:sec-independent protein translocase protein TatB
MGSLSFAEIVTILLVVLVIFGPNRLPEFARKIGELMAQARRATSQFSKDISTEWGDAVEPIMAVKEDFDGVKKDLKDATAAITGLGATAKPTADERTADTADETAADETADETAAEDGTEGAVSDCALRYQPTST